MKKPIALIGLMGSGKTTTGIALAKALSSPFFDTDGLISASEKMSISDIFSLKGEAAFREMETNCLRGLNWRSRFVLSTGGGIITIPASRDILLSSSYVIWLDVAMDVLKKRLLPERDKRPLLRDAQWEKKLENLAHLREKDYKQAHWACAVTNEPADVLVKKIVRHIESME